MESADSVFLAASTVMCAMARQFEFGNGCFSDLRDNLMRESAGPTTLGILAECAIRAVIGPRDADAEQFGAVDYLDVGVRNCAASRRCRAD
ncbi:hypothetical protein ABIA00_003220 [Bradyrhizobium ottawaense]